MLREISLQFINKEISIEEISLSAVIDEYIDYYKNKKLSESEQVEYLEFINTLFKLKHKYIINFNLISSHKKRDMQNFYLKKIQTAAKCKIKKIYIRNNKELEHKQEVSIFRRLINSLFKQNNLLNEKTKNLVDKILKEKWTISDKTKMLKFFLKQDSAFKFQKMLDTNEKEELVTSFAALLDMIKQDKVDVHQEENFGEITVIKKD